MKEIIMVLIWAALDGLIEDIIREPLMYIIFILSIIVYLCVVTFIEVCYDVDYRTGYHGKG